MKWYSSFTDSRQCKDREAEWVWSLSDLFCLRLLHWSINSGMSKEGRSETIAFCINMITRTGIRFSCLPSVILSDDVFQRKEQERKFVQSSGVSLFISFSCEQRVQLCHTEERPEDIPYLCSQTRTCDDRTEACKVSCNTSLWVCISRWRVSLIVKLSRESRPY